MAPRRDATTLDTLKKYNEASSINYRLGEMILRMLEIKHISLVRLCKEIELDAKTIRRIFKGEVQASKITEGEIKKRYALFCREYGLIINNDELCRCLRLHPDSPILHIPGIPIQALEKAIRGEIEADENGFIPYDDEIAATVVEIGKISLDSKDLEVIYAMLDAPLECVPNKIAPWVGGYIEAKRRLDNIRQSLHLTPEYVYKKYIKDSPAPIHSYSKIRDIAMFNIAYYTTRYPNRSYTVSIMNSAELQDSLGLIISLYKLAHPDAIIPDMIYQQGDDTLGYYKPNRLLDMIRTRPLAIESEMLLETQAQAQKNLLPDEETSPQAIAEQVYLILGYKCMGQNEHTLKEGAELINKKGKYYIQITDFGKAYLDWYESNENWLPQDA